ncbi:MAG: 16S rRNA (guanine(966)-N(2))-methyltransferase RsmD [bacterium]|nr:MAG: 16S rRNA (guanine(966)-N(2))-methyltransferase RsmD [bacterium]
MRIIAGTAKGRRLRCPRGSRTRPTSDRVRESIFSIIGSRVEGARVLDLYAGTGAMGLEALSRGASLSVFVEKDQTALRHIRENITGCGFEGVSRIVRSPVLPFLKGQETLDPFDLVFLDPPYGSDQGTLTLLALTKHAKSLQGSLIVLEQASGVEPGPVPPGLRIADSRRYGSTRVTLLTLENSGEE